MNTQSIPLNQLKLSPRNVRKTQTSVASLAASIRAVGLINNLSVERVNSHFEVVAGGRRLQALQQLAGEKHLAEDAPIACTVLEPANITEVSLAENAMRESMHPADQFEAFQRVLNEGATVDEVAEHFSVQPQFVRQRMKLANVAPSILEAYRNSKLDLKAVEAFSLSDDQGEQLRVFKAGGRYEQDIRRELTQKAIPSTDKRIIALGGLPAYEKAGGAVLRDLFDENGGGYAVDTKLVGRLLAEKLEEVAAKTRKEGWAFVDVAANRSPYEYQQHAKPDKSKHGALVSVSYRGDIEITRGVAKPEPKTAAGKAAGAAKAKSAPAKPGDLSEKARGDLCAARDLRMALHLAKSPRIALAALAAAIAHQLLRVGMPDGVDAVAYLELPGGWGQNSTKDDPSQRALVEREKELRSLVPKSGAILPWMLKQPASVIEKIIALGIAQSAAADEFGDYGGGDVGRDFAIAIGTDPGQSWSVTPGWLAAQPLAYMEHAVREACGDRAANELIATDGTAAKAGKAAKLLQDAGWRPAPLRGADYGKKASKSAVSKASGSKPAKKAPAKKKPTKKAATKAKK